MHFVDIIKIPIGENKFVDISRAGIDAYLGEKDSIATRNNVSLKLDNGIPGTGIFTWHKDGKINPIFLLAVSFAFFIGFSMLTLMAVYSDYSIDKFISDFFTFPIILFVILFFLINGFGIASVYYYKKKQCERITRYKNALHDEIENVRAAFLKAELNTIKYDILSSYLGCLYVEQEIIEVEPVMSALKNYSKEYDSIREGYENRYKELQEELQENRYKVDSSLDKDQLINYHHFCESFEILSSGGRFWDITSNPKKWIHTTFGTGVFDYIYSNSYPPIMKTASGVTIYFYSKFILVARSTVDFDILPLDAIDIKASLLPENKKYAIISIEPLGYTFTTTSADDANFFIKVFESFRNGEYRVDYLMLKADSLLEETALYVILKRKVSHEMIRRHLSLGNTRTRRILHQLEEMKIISSEDQDGYRSILIWDIEKIRNIIDDYKKSSNCH